MTTQPENKDKDELGDDQLDKVTGGLVVPSILGILVGTLTTTITKVRDAVAGQ